MTKERMLKILNEYRQVLHIFHKDLEKWDEMAGDKIIKELKNECCTWTEQDGYWESDCNYAFSLEDKTPIKNGMKFCCSCGRKLITTDIKED